jgi:MoxR-like ATPase
MAGRTYVIPDDVQREARAVMPHRVQTATAETTGRDVVSAALANVPVE